MKTKTTLLLFSIVIAGFSSCYYDVEEELYPAYSTNVCDTMNLSYAQNIRPLIDNMCNSCHGTGIGLGNVTLSTYADLQPYIGNGSLVGAIEHSSGFSPMPKGSTKLSKCSISQVKAWINQGAGNN